MISIMHIAISRSIAFACRIDIVDLLAIAYLHCNTFEEKRAHLSKLPV